MVGAVVVKNGMIIGYGYHKKYGGYHAELNALLKCMKNAKGSTLYVNLEPCSHYGKTPPCTDIIIKSKVKRVVIGTKDPNPIVCGKGISELKNNGIDVRVGILEKHCRKLNDIFFYHIKANLPFIAIKFAQSADGKIATTNGMSKWITNKESRTHAHYLRSIYSAVLVGVGTVKSDNPMLNCRLSGKRDPIRIICDSNLTTPINSQIVKSAKDQLTYIACSGNDEKKIKEFENLGVKVLKIPNNGEHISLKYLLTVLYQEGIDSVLVEGGSRINYSFCQSGLINTVYSYIASKIIGGETAKTPVGGDGFSDLKDSLKLKKEKVKFLGNDILIKYKALR